MITDLQRACLWATFNQDSTATVTIEGRVSLLDANGLRDHSDINEDWLRYQCFRALCIAPFLSGSTEGDFRRDLTARNVSVDDVNDICDHAREALSDPEFLASVFSQASKYAWGRIRATQRRGKHG